MSTRSVRLLVMGLLCSLLPLASILADAPAAATTSRLESLLVAHDVRNLIRAHDVPEVIHAPRASSSDCLKTEAERGR